MGRAALPVAGQDFGAIADGAAPERVLMICPPYQTTALSSLSTVLLATYLRDHNVEVEEAHLHFKMAELLGLEAYQSTANSEQGLLGELLFAEALHGSCPDRAMEARLTELFGSRSDRTNLLARFEAHALGVLSEVHPTLVGITTSLNQLLPAIWLSRIVKRVFPSMCVVLGGSACAEPMGQRVLDSYPELDFVVSGYGESPLLALARGARPTTRLLKSYQSPNLDDLPIPDYSAFLRDAALLPQAKVSLCFESSRGCWWGIKNHCTFCGLNGQEMAFLQKSSDRVVHEIRTLWDRHSMNLFATDSILSRNHLKDAVPRLASFESGPILFYEVKANMTASEVTNLRRANIRAIQPGIESLGPRLLKLLKKGTSTIQNLALLKWCAELGIAVEWNLLCGIPGETLADYQEQMALMAKIPQFSPPATVNPIRIDRYSPYFEDYRGHGWSELRPFSAYRHLHPTLDEEGLNDIAYHFAGVGGVSTDLYLEPLKDAVDEWQRRCRAGQGLFLHPDRGLVKNLESGAMRLSAGPLLERLLERTHEINRVDRLLAELRCKPSVFEQLSEQGILFIEDGKVLNLAVRVRRAS